MKIVGTAGVMTHTLTIEVSEEVYKSLLESAAQFGEKPEVVAAKLVAHGAEAAMQDPLRRLFGTLETSIPDWGDQHDRYIGESLLREISQSAPDGNDGN